MSIHIRTTGNGMHWSLIILYLLFIIQVYADDCPNSVYLQIPTQGPITPITINLQKTSSYEYSDNENKIELTPRNVTSVKTFKKITPKIFSYYNETAEQKIDLFQYFLINKTSDEILAVSQEQDVRPLYSIIYMYR